MATATTSPPPTTARPTTTSPAPLRRAATAVAEVAVLLACLVAGFVLVGVVIEEGRGDGWIALDLLLTVVGTAALPVRRRWPLAVAVTLAVATALSAGAAPAAFVALYGLARRRSWTTACAPAAVVVASAAVDGSLHPDPSFPVWLLAVVALVVVVPVVSWGAYRGARDQLLVTLHQRALDAEADLHQRQDQARARERARIAREMHDVLAHRLSLVSLHAGALEVAVDAPRADVARAAEAVRTSAHAALEDLREVLGVLRADDVAPVPAPGGPLTGTGHPQRPQPTLADLPELVQQARAAGTDVELRQHLRDSEVPPAVVARTVHRVVQEALTNARKHAAGHRVLVSVRRVGAVGGTLDAVEVVVEDCSAGSPAEAPSRVPGAGLGLVGLAERVALAGGRLESGPTASGFRLRAVLPLHREPATGSPADRTDGGSW